MRINILLLVMSLGILACTTEVEDVSTDCDASTQDQEACPPNDETEAPGGGFDANMIPNLRP